jgi:hypothetical protein
MGQRPNKPIQPTPLCGLKIVGILQSGFELMLYRFSSAARLMGNPLGCSQPERKLVYVSRCPWWLCAGGSCPRCIRMSLARASWFGQRCMVLPCLAPERLHPNKRV